MKQKRRINAYNRLEKQLKGGIKRIKGDTFIPLTDKEKQRIQKEMDTLKPLLNIIV